MENLTTVQKTWWNALKHHAEYGHGYFMTEPFSQFKNEFDNGEHPVDVSELHCEKLRNPNSQHVYELF